MFKQEQLQLLFSLEGKVALVTGSARGLGWAIAQHFAAAGATVVINDLAHEEVLARVEELKLGGFPAHGMAFDVTDHQAVRASVDDIREKLGSIDVVVNNAGIQNRKRIVDYHPAEWDKLQQTHLGGAFNVTQAAVRHMIQDGTGGRIVNIGSIATKSTRVPMAAYSSAKGALTAMTAALASELGEYRITCNAIAPGFMATDFTKSLSEDEKFSAFVAERVPLGRWGVPSDVAAAALFLVSPAASYVTGSVLRVDGGTLAYL